MTAPADPYRPLDDEGRAAARRCLGAASGALGTLRDGAPMVTRAATLWVEGTGLTLLVSDLSDHARALAADGRCSVLLGAPEGRGDPLAHPRLTLLGRAEAVEKGAHRARWAAARPKTGLYYDFADFRLWRVAAEEGLLNGGFGRAYRMGAADLAGL